MTDSTTARESLRETELTLLSGVRRLVIVAVLGIVAMDLLIRGSVGGCHTADDGTQCVTLTLRPNSGLMAVLFAVVVIWAIDRVLRTAGDRAAARRFLNRAALTLAIIAFAGIVVSSIWVRAVPLPIGESYSLFSPFPFGSIAVDMTWE